MARLRDLPLYRLMKNSLVYGVGDVVQRFLSLLLLPIYTRFLDPSDYGILGLLGIFSLLLGALTMCGLTNGIGRYIYYTREEGADEAEVVWSPLLFITLFSAVVLGTAGLFTGRLSLALFDAPGRDYLIALTLLNIFVANLAGVGRSLLIFKERAGLVNLINIGGVCTGAACGIYLVAFRERGVTGVVEAGLLSSLLMSVPTLLAGVGHYRPSFSSAMLKKQLRFSLPLVAAVFAFWFIDSSDRYLLKLYLPLEEVGLYDIGYRFGMMVNIAVGGFCLAWPPYYHGRNRHGEGQQVCSSVLNGYLLFMAPLVVLVSLVSPWVIRLLTTPGFHEAYTVVPWVAAAYMLKGPYVILLMGILMMNLTGRQLYLETAAAGLNIAGNIILIPILGREAAALTTLASYAFMCAGAWWMVKRVNPIPGLRSFFMVVVLVATFATSAAAVWIPRGTSRPLAAGVSLFVIFCAFLLAAGLAEFTRKGREISSSHRRSLLFVNPDYHYSFTLQDELRKRGWRADVLVPENYPPDLLSRDDGLRLPGEGRGRAVRALGGIASLASFLLRYRYFVIYGSTNIVFLPATLFRRFFGKDFCPDLALAKLFKKEIVYLPSGCHEIDTRSRYRRLDGGAVCGNCGWGEKDCNESLNLDRLRIRVKYGTFHVGLGAEESSQYKVRHMKYKSIDLEQWRPDLEIPPEFLLPPTDKVRVMHSFHDANRRRGGKNIKGSPYIVEAVERLEAEGCPVEYFHASNVPSRSMRYYQVQADIVVDQLIYGWWGSTGIEAMALGRPLVCYLRPEWKDRFLRVFPEYSSLPVVEADVETIYEALRRLVSDEPHRRERGRASRRFAERHFDVTINARELEAHLLALEGEDERN